MFVDFFLFLRVKHFCSNLFSFSFLIKDGFLKLNDGKRTYMCLTFAA
ncbi:hypothetical protein DWV63_04550 [Enterococcus durans]|nr:hypothetical protein DWV63_04550 [Enterococcus durans]